MYLPTIACLLLCLVPGLADADAAFPEFSFAGFADLRAIRTDDTLSWTDQGLGKTRYGSENSGSKRSLAQLSEATLQIATRFSWDLTGQIVIKYDPEQRHPIGIMEGFLAYRPLKLSNIGFKSRVGAFFPPGSMENTGVAWTSPYTITPSAINTWIGEEVRTLGAEFTVSRQGERGTIALTSALYKANDPTGSLLAYRGWAMHDRRPGLLDRLPLAAIASTRPGRTFAVQAPWVEPFREIDGRWGYYVNLDWDHRDFLQLNSTYYDNRAHETSFDGNQYAWHTRFLNLGAGVRFDNKFEILMQGLLGNSLMGPKVQGINAVDIDFSAFYVLLTRPFGSHRLSLRYDRFSIDDKDNGFLAPFDQNKENGKAWTLAWKLDTIKKQSLMVELLKIDSERPARSLIGLPVNAEELQFQIRYRFIL